MSKTLQVGATSQASVAFVNKDGGSATVVSQAWSSLDPTVASVDATSGLVTAVGPGSTTIRNVAEGDATPGVDTITTDGALIVVAEEASSGAMSFA